MNLSTLIRTAFPYEDFWPYQEDCIREILEYFLTGGKHFVLEAPTATGKSAIAYTVAKVISQYLSTRGIILTKTRSLQTQYNNQLGVPTIWSPQHYPCNIDPENKEAFFNSSECIKEFCYAYSRCRYLKDRDYFLAHNVGVSNYAYYLKNPLIASECVVCDEAHSLESIITDHLSVEFNPTGLALILELFHSFVSKEENTERLLNSIVKIFESRSEQVWRRESQLIIDDLEKVKTISERRVKEVEKNPSKVPNKKSIFLCHSYLNSLYEKIILFLSSKSKWVESLPNTDLEEADSESLVIKPLQVRDDSKLLFNNSKFFLFMSATLSESEIRAIGVNSFKYKEVKASIPASNRRVNLLNLPGLNKNNKEQLILKYIEIIDELLNQAKGIRGIIHTVSYENAEIIKKLSRHHARMVIPKVEQLQRMDKLLSNIDTVLVSPAIVEGLDLANDLSRFQIFLKIPFPFLGDPWTAKKAELDKGWYLRKAAVEIMQGSGRSIRSVNDHAITFVLDGHVKMIKRYFSNWFLDSLQQKN